MVSWFSSSVSHQWSKGFLPNSYFPFQPFLRLVELTSEERGNCNNVSFEAESSQSRSHVTIINHDFTLSDLTFITTLNFFSSTPLSRRCLVPLHLCHRVGVTSTYKSEGYSVRHVSGMIQNDKGEQKCDDKNLGR